MATSTLFDSVRDCPVVGANQFAVELSEVRDWFRLGVHLQVSITSLKEIEEKYKPNGSFRCLIELYEHLTREVKSFITWGMIVASLREMDCHGLADKIEDRVRNSITDITPIPQPHPPFSVVVETPCVAKIAEEYDSLSKRFIRLQGKMKKAFLLSADIDSNLRWLQDFLWRRFRLARLPPYESTVDAVFDRLEEHCPILHIGDLKFVVEEIPLLNKPAVLEEIATLEKLVDDFKRSANMVDLVTHIRAKYPEIIVDESKTMTLKVKEFWAEFTLKQFEIIVQKILQILYRFVSHISVTNGCLCISWLIPDDLNATKFIEKLPLAFVRTIGVIYLHIGEVEFYSHEEEEAGRCETIEAAMIQAVELKNMQAIEMLLSVGCRPDILAYNKRSVVTNIVNIKEKLSSNVCHHGMDRTCIWGYSNHVRAILVPGCKPECALCDKKEGKKRILIEENDRCQKEINRISHNREEKQEANKQLQQKKYSLQLSLRKKDVQLQELRNRFRRSCAPYSYLYKRFPSWIEDNQIHMIPPVYVARHQSSLDPQSSPEDAAEEKLYNLFKELGELQESGGMFVFNGFDFKDVARWKKFYGDRKIPELLSATGKSDFIVFHHSTNALGVLCIESKSYENSSIVALNHHFKSSERKLALSQEVVLKLAMTKASSEKSHLTWFSELRVCKKVIALPATSKSIFASLDRNQFKDLERDTLLMFAEDMQDVQSFRNWWLKEAVATQPDALSLSQPRILATNNPIFTAYETALSYIVMVSHLSTPIVYSDSVKEFHKLLATYKFLDKPSQPFPDTEFPYLRQWLSKIAFDINEIAETKQLQKALMVKHKLKSETDLVNRRGMKLWNQLLERGEQFVDAGDNVEMDEIEKLLAKLFNQNYLVFHKSILRFLTHFSQRPDSQISGNKATLQHQQDVFPFTKLESLLHLNLLGQHLESHEFIAGDSPSEIDGYVMELLTQKMRLEHTRFPIVLTAEQLTVFEGPEKQLVIGPPGSGKTELLKFKVKELEDKIRANQFHTRILFILANGSPLFRNSSLIAHKMKKFFRSSKVVDVMSICLKPEFTEALQEAIMRLRENIASGKYGHVFIDEYWIGSKSPEHEVILEIIEGIKGYVWITSSFDVNMEYLMTSARGISQAKPLFDTLERNNGTVNHICTVTRSTNSIINLERDYCQLFQRCDYPFGTIKGIYGHSLEGLPISWEYVATIDLMYTKCIEIISPIIAQSFTDQSLLKRNPSLVLKPADILIVDFAVRLHESAEIQPLNHRLISSGIQVLNLDIYQDHDDTKGDEEQLCLLSSFNHDTTKYIDGVEWPMVIVILPSGLLLETSRLLDHHSRHVYHCAETLSSYDLFIALFRAMVKLVVISDKWTCSNEFLTDMKWKSTESI